MLDGFVVEIDGRPIGCALCNEVDGDTELVVLVTTYRGAGAGTALLEAVVERGAPDGWKRLWLVTSNDNTDGGTMEFVDAFTGERVKRPFYDGLKIHSVHYMERFEAGDPTGTSRGAPPVWVPKENGPFDFSRPYRVGMTAAALKRISGVLFFVSAVSEPYLNTSHNCFGEVVVGKDAVDRIVGVRTDENKVPVDPVTIEHIRIRAVGSPPPIPEPRPYRPPIPVFKPRDPSLIR